LNKGNSNIKYAFGCFLAVVSIVFIIFFYKSVYTNRKSTKESTTTENTTEQMTETKTEKETETEGEQSGLSEQSGDATMYVYNKISGDKNIFAKGKIPEDVKKIIDMVVNDKNLVYTSDDYKDFYDELYASSTYPEGTANPSDIFNHLKEHVSSLKDLELNNLLNIETNETNITYLGNNTWSVAKASDHSVKIYSTENLEYPSLPYTALVARLCMPTGFADSEARSKSVEEQYKEFSNDDVQKYFDNASVDSENISTAKVIALSSAKINCLNEMLYVYRDPSSYVNIFASTVEDGKSTGYAYDKDDYNHATGFSNEENCYEYLKLNNESFYREAHEDIYYKADEFRSDYVQPDQPFLYYLFKNYKFSYTFNVSVDNDSYVVQVYNKDDAYVSLLLSTSKGNNPQQIWVSDNNGTILISEASMNSEKDLSKALDQIKESVSYAKEHLGKEKDKNKKQQKSEEPTNNNNEEGLGDLVSQSEIVKDLMDRIKNNKPFTLDYAVKDNGPDVVFHNTTDGNNTYAKMETPSIDKSCTMIVYDDIKYTSMPDNSNEPEVYWKEELTERNPAYMTMFLPEPLNSPESTSYVGTYKAKNGVIEQWKCNDTLVSFNIVNSKLYSFSYNVKDRDEPVMCIVNRYKPKAISNLLKKPENIASR